MFIPEKVSKKDAGNVFLGMKEGVGMVNILEYVDIW
jgi:hypothetical protein